MEFVDYADSRGFQADKPFEMEFELEGAPTRLSVELTVPPDTRQVTGEFGCAPAGIEVALESMTVSMAAAEATDDERLLVDVSTIPVSDGARLYVCRGVVRGAEHGSVLIDQHRPFISLLF